MAGAEVVDGGGWGLFRCRQCVNVSASKQTRGDQTPPYNPGSGMGHERGLGKLTVFRNCVNLTCGLVYCMQRIET
jgi:hypothetical protein